MPNIRRYFTNYPSWARNLSRAWAIRFLDVSNLKLGSEDVARFVSLVTATMFGRTFKPSLGKPPIDPWRVAILPIAGARPIRVALSSDRQGCSSLAAQMLGIDEDSLDLPMIDDVLRELTNMAAGQIKSQLSIDQALGLPKVFDGDELTSVTTTWTHYQLISDSIHLLVSVSASAP